MNPLLMLFLGLAGLLFSRKKAPPVSSAPRTSSKRPGLPPQRRPAPSASPDPGRPEPTRAGVDTAIRQKVGPRPEDLEALEDAEELEVALIAGGTTAAVAAAVALEEYDRLGGAYPPHIKAYQEEIGVPPTGKYDDETDERIDLLVKLDAALKEKLEREQYDPDTSVSDEDEDEEFPGMPSGSAPTPGPSTAPPSGDPTATDLAAQQEAEKIRQGILGNKRPAKVAAATALDAYDEFGGKFPPHIIGFQIEIGASPTGVFDAATYQLILDLEATEQRGGAPAPVAKPAVSPQAAAPTTTVPAFANPHAVSEPAPNPNASSKIKVVYKNFRYLTPKERQIHDAAWSHALATQQEALEDGAEIPERAAIYLSTYLLDKGMVVEFIRMAEEAMGVSSPTGIPSAQTLTRMQALLNSPSPSHRDQGDFASNPSEFA